MKIIIVLFIHVLVQMCTGNQTDMASSYKVQKLIEQPEINAVWDKMPWNKIEPLQVKNYMGDKPEHFPFTQAKVAYDNTAIYVIYSQAFGASKKIELLIIKDESYKYS